MASKKRKYGDDYMQEEVYSNKARARPAAEGRVDPTYGQRSAIPGLDEDTVMLGSDEELNYDDDDDGKNALAYLRAVRKEATAIPNLLVAPKIPVEDEKDLYADEPEEPQGWYEDGAYLSATRPGQDAADIASRENAKVQAQLMYFGSILQRYNTLKEQLQQMPPADAVAILGDDRPTWVPPLNKGISKAWVRRMTNLDPKPAQIASMDKNSVFKLLRLLTSGTMLKRNAKLNVGICRWVWSLLARVPDRGELNSEEIGVVRELGKKAVLVGMGLAEKSAWEEGIKEVEREFDEDEPEREVSVLNENEIQLDDDDGSMDEDKHGGLPEADELLLESETFDLHPPSSNSDEADKPEEIAAATEVLSTEALKGNNDAEGAVLSGNLQNALAAAKASLLNAITNEEPTLDINLEPETQEPASTNFSPEWNTRTLVDMIITVAGEAYGQRDLLEFRGMWNQVL